MLLIGIDAGRHFIEHRLFDDQRAVAAHRDLEAIHRTWSRSFEVQAADVIARAMTRTFELLLRLEPSRGAPEMCALREDGVEALLGADDPRTEILLELFADLADDVVIGEAGFEFRGRKKQHARERAANCREQSDGCKRAEAAPSEATEEITPAP